MRLEKLLPLHIVCSPRSEHFRSDPASLRHLSKKSPRHMKCTSLFLSAKTHKLATTALVEHLQNLSPRGCYYVLIRHGTPDAAREDLREDDFLNSQQEVLLNNLPVKADKRITLPSFCGTEKVYSRKGELMGV